MGARAARAAGEEKREAQLHTAEQKQKKRRMAAILARDETALESRPISSVCH